MSVREVVENLEIQLTFKEGNVVPDDHHYTHLTPVDIRRWIRLAKRPEPSNFRLPMPSIVEDHIERPRKLIVQVVGFVIAAMLILVLVLWGHRP